MKKMMILAFLFMSTAAFGRQYIQCSDPASWDGAVINIDGNNSTLFMTNGVHLPDEDRIDVLKTLELVENNGETAIYVTQQGPVVDKVIIPSEVMGRYSRSFIVTMIHFSEQGQFNRSRDMYCFSAIYND